MSEDWLDELEQRDDEETARIELQARKNEIAAQKLSGLYRALHEELIQEASRYRKRFPANSIQGPGANFGYSITIRKTSPPGVTLKIVCCPQGKIDFEFARTKEQSSETESEHGSLKPEVDDSDDVFLQAGDQPTMTPKQAAVFLLRQVVESYHDYDK